MKTTQEVFKEVLDDLGFSGHLPSQMTNSDYWLCTNTAMERYAELVEKTTIPVVSVVKQTLFCACMLPTSNFELDNGTICCCLCEKELAK